MGYRIRTYNQAKTMLPDDTALAVERNSKALLAAGYKERKWRAKGAPLDRNTSHWLDHEYGLLSSTGGYIWVTEPYQIYGDAIQDLARLQNEGWNVSIIPLAAVWNPGATVAVWIQKNH